MEGNWICREDSLLGQLDISFIIPLSILFSFPVSVQPKIPTWTPSMSTNSSSSVFFKISARERVGYHLSDSVSLQNEIHFSSSMPPDDRRDTEKIMIVYFLRLYFDQWSINYDSRSELPISETLTSNIIPQS